MTDQVEKSEPKRLDQHFFERPVEIVAPDLIGCHLFTTIKGHRVGGMIIETEAYDGNDLQLIVIQKPARDVERVATQCFLVEATPMSMRIERCHA